MADDSLHEEWRPVEGWPYEVSNLGRVRRTTSGSRPRASGIDGRGYPALLLHDIGRPRKPVRVHRLVALAFLGPPPTSRHEVAHIDGDRRNSRASNLRWSTRTENNRDKITHGTITRGASHWNCKITADDAIEIRRRHAAGEAGMQKLAIDFSLSRSAIHQIVRRERWAWLPDSAA